MCELDAALQGFSIDDFRPAAGAFFLTHAHRDHLLGLRKKFRGAIFCTAVTRDLLRMERPYLDADMFHVMRYESPVVVGNASVVALRAYHCDGSAMFLFVVGPRVVLYTGDFRLVHLPRMPAPDVVYFDDTLAGYASLVVPTYEQSLEDVRRLLSELRDPVTINVQVLGVEMLLRALAESGDVTFRLRDTHSYRAAQVAHLVPLDAPNKRVVFLGMRSLHDTGEGEWIFPTLTRFLCREQRAPPNHHYVFFSTHPSLNEIDALGARLGAKKMVACNYRFPKLKCAE